MSQDQHQRCFNHDYRASFFYVITMTTAPRRPLFGTCSDNRTHLSEDGATVERLWHAISADYPKIVWRDGSLAAYTAYIRDNPRRHCLKKAHPDLFRRVERLEHAALPPINGGHSTYEGAVAPIHGRAWSSYGSPNLPEDKITRETCLFLNDCAAHIAAINGGHSTPQSP